MENLAGILAFVRSVELGSQTAAAQDLGLSRMAVSRQIQSLEQRLGVQLLQRTTRRQVLTEAGGVYFNEVRPALEKLREAGQMASEARGGLHGLIRINAPVSFATRSLAPVLARFCALYPEIRLEVDLDDRHVDLIGGGYDLILRIGQTRDSSLISRRLATFCSRICASPAYLERRGTPKTIADLAAHDCLRYANGLQARGWELANEEGEIILAPVGGSLMSNNGDFLFSAALAGQGIIRRGFWSSCFRGMCAGDTICRRFFPRRS